MSKLLIALGALLALASCASNRLSEAEELALYRSHAGEPVSSFQFFGRMNGWNPLGDSALVVQTRPNQSYLLETTGPCTDLEWAPAITLTNLGSRVYARFDKVIVLGGSPNPTRFPCRIESIRPLDVKALRQSQKQLREANAAEREGDPTAPRE